MPTIPETQKNNKTKAKPASQSVRTRDDMQSNMQTRNQRVKSHELDPELVQKCFQKGMMTKQEYFSLQVNNSQKGKITFQKPFIYFVSSEDYVIISHFQRWRFTRNELKNTQVP